MPKSEQNTKSYLWSTYDIIINNGINNFVGIIFNFTFKYFMLKYCALSLFIK